MRISDWSSDVCSSDLETWDVDSAMRTLRALAAAEANPALVALQAAAKAHGLPCLPDDDEVSIGAGTGGQAWPADALPDPATIDWSTLHAIPTALVTGSTRKTTTVRLLAALAPPHGRPAPPPPTARA